MPPSPSENPALLSGLTAIEDMARRLRQDMEVQSSGDAFSHPWLDCMRDIRRELAPIQCIWEGINETESHRQSLRPLAMQLLKSGDVPNNQATSGETILEALDAEIAELETSRNPKLFDKERLEQCFKKTWHPNLQWPAWLLRDDAIVSAYFMPPEFSTDKKHPWEEIHLRLARATARLRIGLLLQDVEIGNIRLGSPVDSAHSDEFKMSSNPNDAIDTPEVNAVVARASEKIGNSLGRGFPWPLMGADIREWLVKKTSEPRFYQPFNLFVRRMIND